MSIASSLRLAACGLACLSLAPAVMQAADAVPPRSNILLIQADDLGFSDLGCYGGEIPTPNLDRLAAGGVRFTQYYSNAKCEPSRNSLMTGQYPVWQGETGRTVVLAEEMRAAGYRTCISGKVHMHTVAGFERSFTMGAAGSYWDLTHGSGKPGWPLTIDGEAVAEPAKRFPGFYTTDAFADEAVRWLEAGKDQGKPFFLYLAFNAPHYPLHAPAADIARHRGRYREGWDALRQRRWEKQRELGFWPEGLRLSPRDPAAVRAWADLTPEEREREDLRMATYAAMVERMDSAIGRVLAQIEAQGATKDTLVVFTSDNGACHREAMNGPEPGPPGSFWMTGPGWAWLSNTPFRRFKTHNHEGGISDPLILSWPGRLAPAMDRQVAHITDLTATCLALAGRGNDRILGLPLLPGAGGGERRTHAELCWAVIQSRAIRRGDLKAVFQPETGWELYDLATDRTELDDLATSRPQELAALVGRWEAWVTQVEVIGSKPKTTATPRPLPVSTP